MKFFRWVLLFTLIFLIRSVSAAESDAAIKFISVADIHFDPFSQCLKSVKQCKSFDSLQSARYQDWHKLFEQLNITKGSSYKDSSYGVLHESLLHMQKINEIEKPAFVIILGDFLSHNFHEDFLLHSKDKSHRSYEAFVLKTFQYLCDEFSRTFPGINIYPVIGNNDSYHGDYYVDPNGQFYKDLTRVWVSTILDKNNRENFQTYFPKIGYYEINLSNDPSKKLIVLNSIVFSSYALGKKLKDAANEEFQWLENRLQTAEKNQEKVVLAYHIPVGIDVYATVQSKLNTIAQFWKMRYTKQFEELLLKYPVVSTILSGHIHIDSFQAITLKQFGGVSVNITPSISPIFGNEPAFKLITLNKDTLAIDHTETYYSPLSREAHWKPKKMHHSRELSYVSK